MTERVVAFFSGGGTGGHLYPALGLAGALSELRPDVHPFFVGASRGIEARVLREKGVDHILLPIEGFRRDSLVGNLRVLRLLGRALMEVAAAFRSLRPCLVVVTGGYAGGPAGLMAILTRTRLILQEQNSVPGITTRALASFAREIHLAFPEAVERLPRRSRRRARVSGNPVRPPQRISREDGCAFFGLDPAAIVLLVTGGSQGSAVMNSMLLDAVKRVASGELLLPGGVQLLWATGPTHFEGIQRELIALGDPSWVRAVGYIDDMPAALSISGLAISRAGAMATSEYLAWGIPAILIPLPTAAADHQTENALVLAEAGAAIHLSQAGLTGPRLWDAVAALLRDRETMGRMADRALKRGKPDAAREIALSFSRYLPPRPSASGDRGNLFSGGFR
jgi:UDP-N-acetylglucosamine--N-acetylmuramyl-(pentapeptide) pyrophosphoryl-undecaprenol N-acetylglucosamine transferase